MRDDDGGLRLRQRATPRTHGERPRPVLDCAIVVETLPLFAEGLVRLLHELAEIRMVATAPTAAGLRGLLSRLRPELVVLDLDARDTRPLDAARLLRRFGHGAKLVFLSASFSSQTIPTLLRAGAAAVLLKSAHPTHMRATLSRVLGACADARAGGSGTPVRVESAAIDPHSLSQREREVLAYVALGFTVKRTADMLGLSPKTIESHRTRLMAKLEIHDRVMLTHYALHLGIVPQMSLPTRRPRAVARAASRAAAT